jgi:prevent-host-death family protein
VKRIALGTLKKQFLFLIDHLDPDGLVITKHGKPVARLLPIERAPTNRIAPDLATLSLTPDAIPRRRE